MPSSRDRSVAVAFPPRTEIETSGRDVAWRVRPLERSEFLALRFPDLRGKFDRDPRSVYLALRRYLVAVMGSHPLSPGLEIVMHWTPEKPEVVADKIAVEVAEDLVLEILCLSVLELCASKL